MESFVAPPGLNAENGVSGTKLVRTLRMSRTQPECWALLPFLVERIQEWGRRWGQADLAPFTQRLEAAFVLGHETVAAWAVLDGMTGKLVGHLVTVEEFYNGHKLGFIVQAVADTKAVPMEVQQGLMREAEAWAKAQGYPELLMITNRRRPRAWKRLYGLEEFRYVYRKVIDQEAKNG